METIEAYQVIVHRVSEYRRLFQSSKMLYFHEFFKICDQILNNSILLELVSI